ncbi:MAG: dihydroorotate dehydrogenase electron transfer subunit [Chitinivibrionales bacterium]|nr:dihydroorotate dehydrogenase electron transfer subunit [Chitinivibrionales bacterium]
MLQHESAIRGNNPICESFHETTFDWPTTADRPHPGQFLSIRISTATAPLLRRPFAFSDIDPKAGTASIIYQTRGPATELLAGKSAGETLDIVGPLGRGFPEPAGKGTCVLVAGGIGLGPMLFLAKHLRGLKREVLFVYGCAREALVPRSESFRRANAVVCTDDGSVGYQGTNVAYLRTLPESRFAGATVYACGPNPMMKACHELAGERGAPCYVSMEQVMACGVGACMGCVVKTTSGDGFARVCTEGPVFDSREIAW